MTEAEKVELALRRVAAGVWEHGGADSIKFWLVRVADEVAKIDRDLRKRE